MKSKLLLLAFSLMAVLCSAQTAVQLLPSPKMQFMDSTGTVPLALGKVCTYQAGTTTPLATYTDSTGNVQNTNPVILDVAGRAQIWWAAAAYKVTLLAPGTDSTCNTGSQIWSIDNVSANSVINAVVKNPSGTQTVTGTLASTGILLCKNLEGIRCVNPTNTAGWSGSELGAWVNSAWADCANACLVYVSPGTYNAVTTTINYPVATNGTAGLWIDPGAVINYTGSGHAVEVNGSGQAALNLNIFGGGRIIGTSSGLSGLHLVAFNKGSVSNLRISGFTTGDGVLNEGANTVDFYSSDIRNNKNGVHEVGKVVSAVNYSANANHFYGGTIASNTGYGIYEDGSLAGTVGPNLGNTYDVTLEANGLNANPGTSGNAFIQRCDKCELKGYSEYGAGQTLTNNILVGDGTSQVKSLKIDMILLSTGATNSVNNFNGDATYLPPSARESAVTTNLVLNGALSNATQVIFVRSAATNYFAGSDTFANSLVWGYTNPTQVNGLTPTARGLRLTSAVLPVIRSEGAGIAIQRADGTGVGSIDETGAPTWNGGVRVGASGTLLTQAVAYSQTITPASVAAATVAEQTFTVTGLTTADKVIVNPAATGNSTAAVSFRVSAANTLAVQFVNPTAGALTPGAGTWNIIAIRN